MTTATLVPDTAEDRLDRFFVTLPDNPGALQDFLLLKNELGRLRRQAKATVPVPQVEILRTALEPFAKSFVPEWHLRDDPRIQQFLDENTVTPRMTVGDFRRAWVALGEFDAQRIAALTGA